MTPMVAMSVLYLRNRLETPYRKMARLAAITVVVYLGLTLSKTLSGFAVDAPAEITPPVASAPPAKLPREW